MSTASTEAATSPSLPTIGGRAPRIALLDFREPSNDSRVLKTAESLQRAGAQVVVIGLAPDGSGLPTGLDDTHDGPPLYRTSDLDLSGLLARVPQVRRTARLVRYWACAVRASRRFGADVVHANDGNTLGPAIVLRLLAGTRFVYDSHELWTRRNARPGRWLAPHVEALTERVGVRLADAVITVSPSIAQWLQRHYRMRRPPVLVRNIPPWPGRPPVRSEGRLRELAGLSESDRVISYCGGIVTGRGLEETIDALRMLGDDIHLVILGFGSSDYVATLLARAGERGVTDRVHVLPPVPGPQVPQTLADADLAVVYVRPIVLSYAYSLPNKLFESIHAGLPIVAADLPDTAEVVRRYGVGEVFSAEAPAELAAAIEEVLADPDAYREAAHAAAADLDWNKEAARLIEAHANAVRRCRP